jgi:hypothetical protein
MNRYLSAVLVWGVCLMLASTAWVILIALQVFFGSTASACAAVAMIVGLAAWLEYILGS